MRSGPGGSAEGEGCCRGPMEGAQSGPDELAEADHREEELH